MPRKRSEREWLAPAVGAVFLLAMLTLGVGCSVYRYQECREHGFSTFYCLREFSR